MNAKNPHLPSRYAEALCAEKGDPRTVNKQTLGGGKLSASQAREMKRAQEEAEKMRYASDSAYKRDLTLRLEALRPSFVAVMDQFQSLVYEFMNYNGFWEGEQDNIPSKIALLHSEVSEMLEADRKSIEADDKVPQHSGLVAEGGDVLIRLADLMGRLDEPFGSATIDKMLFNLSRPYKHGKNY